MFGSSAGNLLSKFSFSKIIGGISKTVGTVNQIIPIYKQVKPVVKNVKNVFNSFSSVKKAVNEEAVNKIKSMERPISNFKSVKNVQETRGEILLDTLTFFGNKND